MAKKPSKAELQYVETQRRSLSADQLVEDTGLSKRQIGLLIKKFDLADAVKATAEQPKPAEPEPLKEVKAEDSAAGTAISANVPISDEKRGLAVMTPAAAQWSDEIMKRVPAPSGVNDSDHIFRRPNR